MIASIRPGAARLPMCGGCGRRGVFVSTTHVETFEIVGVRCRFCRREIDFTTVPVSGALLWPGNADDAAALLKTVSGSRANEEG